ncbi:MAG: ABC transporter permease [Armatimonas sp.]
MKRALAELGGLSAALLLIILIFSATVPTFRSASTFVTILNQLPEALLLAAGMTLVILVAEIDLSVGSVVGLAGAVLGVSLLSYHLPLPVAVLLAILSGALCGLFSGLLTTLLRLPAFLVTLGMLEAARGATFLLTESHTQYLGKAVEPLSAGGTAWLSLPTLLALIILALGQMFLSRTTVGKNLFATGGSERTAWLAGIPTNHLRTGAFVVCGALAALAGVVNAGRLSSADPNAGLGAELTAIAAVVIGGTRLTGGRGSLIGTLLGVILLAVVGNGLAQAGAQEPVKRLLTGGIIVGAVLLDRLRSKGGE